MQQTCQYCGYDSPVSDRFCRQCGEAFSSETELSTATTRNYGRQEPAPSVIAVGSSRLPPSVGDAIAGETERYYQAPRPPLAPTQSTAPIKSKIRSWRWFLMFLVLFFCVATSALVTASLVQSNRPSISPEERARTQAQREAQRRQDEARRRIEDQIREYRDRAREAQDRQREAIDRMREAAENAVRAGAALPVTNEKPLDLSQYEYPGAVTSNSIRITGHEMLTMHTPDDFEAVNQFFQKKFGKPIIQINNPIDKWDKKLIFQSDTAPIIAVSVEPDDEANGQLRITVLRSLFWIPKSAEAGNSK